VEICTRLQTLVQDHAAVVSVAAQAVTKVSESSCQLLIMLHALLQRPEPNRRTHSPQMSAAVFLRPEGCYALLHLALALA